ncbi:MAG: O-methyltransferase [Planctomycetota bacterium]|jgi:hypothetical protein
MATESSEVVPAIDADQLPVLSRATLAALDFGEGCLIEEYLLLRALAVLLKPERILEVGTSCGVGGLMLLDGASAFGRRACLTTIDIKRQEAFESNVAQFPHLKDRIERIVGTSDTVLPALARDQGRFDLVFLDGDHSPEQVARDWRNVQPLSDMYVLHDTDQMPGCRDLVAEVRKMGNFDVLSLSYPLGHQVFRGVEAEGRIYDGIYHQQQLGWNTAARGPGLAVIRHRGKG